MENHTEIQVLIITFLLIAGICSGCGSSFKNEILSFGREAHGANAESIIDISAEMVPLTEMPAMFTIPLSFASGVYVKKDKNAEIDYSNTNDGYVMIRCLQDTDKALYVQITGPSGVKYQYSLKPDGGYEVYPLSDGNGSYKIDVLEEIEGNKAALTTTVKIDVKLIDEFAPFIRPNKYVNYNKDSRTVIKAAELIKDENSLIGEISAIYNYVINNVAYDSVKAEKIANGTISVYFPDVDEVLETGKGICFDYASVMAAMLRSQGIPCKIVVGYTGDLYHAWISAYSKETGWIDNIIYFDGKNWKLMDPTFASSGAKSDRIMEYIGAGSNYKAKFLY